ncbi:MAG: transporter [Bacteroidota bacterium]
MIKSLRLYFQFIPILCFISFSALAQYSETIQTARPGQAFGPYSVGTKVFQVQSGFTYSGFDVTGSALDGNAFQFFNALRYGITEKFEIRTAFALSSVETSFGEDDDNIGGFSFWNIGVRYNILSNTGFKPTLAIQTDVALTAVDEDFQTDDPTSRILLLHGQNISNFFRLTTNWGVVFDGNSSDVIGTYVVNLSFSITDKLGSFVEIYGDVQDGDFDIRYDTGIAYLLNNDLQLDASFGYGSNDDLNDWFVDAGVSWRTRFGSN